jgi:hypothetical protein
MGAGEQDASLGKAIHIRSHGIWVAAETSYPVVEVIDSDEKHVIMLRPGFDIKSLAGE